MENIITKLIEKYTLQQTMDSVKGIVKPVFMRLSLERVVEKFDSLPEEYRTDWSKILMDVDKSRGILENLIKSLFGVYGGDIVGFYDLNMDSARRDVTMIFANTIKGKGISFFENKFESHYHSIDIDAKKKLLLDLKK